MIKVSVKLGKSVTIFKMIHHYHDDHNDVDQVYKDLAFCENPLEREQEVEDVKVDKIQSLQQVNFLSHYWLEVSILSQIFSIFF